MTTRPAQNIRYLTSKRAAFLKHFLSFPYISTEQAYKLAQAKTDSAQRGTRKFLERLYRAGYLLREPIVTQFSPTPHWQFSYRLSKHGARVTAGTFTAEKSPYSLSHDSEITQFHIELAEKWTNGALYWQQHNLKKTVNPDALFALSRDGATAHYFFLEVEKSGLGHYRNGESGLEAKLTRYARYRRTVACKQDWNYFDDFRVTVVMTNEERRMNLLHKLRVSVQQRFIWITTEALYRGGILERIFLTPSDFGERAYSLLDL